MSLPSLVSIEIKIKRPLKDTRSDINIWEPGKKLKLCGVAGNKMKNLNLKI